MTEEQVCLYVEKLAYTMGTRHRSCSCAPGGVHRPEVGAALQLVAELDVRVAVAHARHILQLRLAHLQQLPPRLLLQGSNPRAHPHALLFCAAQTGGVLRSTWQARPCEALTLTWYHDIA